MTIKTNNNVMFIPKFIYYEVKNPITLFPVDWEKVYGKEMVRYELEPEFDVNGNYLGDKKNVFVTMKTISGFIPVKKNINCNSKIKMGKLFNLIEDIEKGVNCNE